LLIAKTLYERIGSHRPHGETPEDDLIRRLGRRIVLLRAGAVALS
jgi:hypothetical protein